MRGARARRAERLQRSALRSRLPVRAADRAGLALARGPCSTPRRRSNPARQHVAHCVPPSGFADEPSSSAATRKRRGGNFPLVEYAIPRRDPDIGCQEEFIGNSRHVPLHGDDQRLGALGPACSERIEKTRRSLNGPASQPGTPRRKVQATGEIRSLAVEHSDPKAIIMFELIVRLTERTES